MPPKISTYSRIFATRTAIAGITLAMGLGLAGCPRPAKTSATPTPAQIASVFTVGTIALQTADPRALEKLTEALRLAPQEPAIWANLGLLRLRSQQPDAAAYDLNKANSLLPASTAPTSRAAIEALLALVADSKGDVAGAAAHLKQAVALDPSDLRNRYALALQQEKAQDEAGALQTMQAIAAEHPSNLESLLQSARIAAKQNNAAAFTSAITALDSHSSGWGEEAKSQLATLKSGAKSGTVSRVAVNTQFLKNLLVQNPDWRQSYAMLNPPLDDHNNPVVGTPLEQFVVLPNIADTPAPPDMTVTFEEEKEKRRKGEKERASSSLIPHPSSLFVSALWLSNEGTPQTLIAPVPMWADGKGLHIDAPAYSSVTLPFPRGAGAGLPGPNGILALDFNYDLRTDIVMAGAGGIKFYTQNETGKFTDATAQMKLPLAVQNGAYVGAWGLDYDADGDLDILLARVSGPPLILRCNGNGTFKPIELFSSVQNLRAFAWADVDGDGAPDAALVDDKGKLHVFMNERSGKFVERAAPSEVGNVAAVAVGDPDHDGRLDFLLLRQDGSIVRLSDAKNGAQWEVAPLAQWNNPPHDLTPGSASLFVADLDNNGAPDLIASSPTTSQVWMSDGAKFTPLPSPIAASIGAVADVDGNGRLDLLGTNAQGQPVTLINKGTQNYFWQTLRPRANDRGEVLISRLRANSSPAELNKRINSFGIGGEMEARAGLIYQKQVISAPSVHFGLGTYPTVDAVRVLWPNGDVRGEFELKANAILSVNHRLNVSCPFLFTWNGAEMEFVTDCIWRSPLGLKINAQDTAGISMTEDWVKIRGEQLAPREGVGYSVLGVREDFTPIPNTQHPTPSSVYDLRITAELWETHFFDHLSLMAVDHPVGTEIFCDERFAIPPPPLQVYVTTPPLPVTRAWDDDGNDVTDIVRQRDGRHVCNFARGAYQGVTRDHWVELELGEEVPADGTLYLIAHGWVHPTNSNVNVALSQGDHPVPTGLSIATPDKNGNWQMRRKDLGFPEGKVKTIVLRMDDVFQPDAPRRLRLSTNLEVYWDALQWAVGLPDVETKTTRLAAQTAELQYRGFSQIEAADDSSPELPTAYAPVERQGQKWRDLTGFHTRYGDVLELLETIDDRYVIMNAGDEMRLTFPALPPPEDGWTRDFVLIGDGWVKDGNYNTTFSKTVLPLPAHDLPDYNTPPGSLEDDPVYCRHPEDWQTYHTRYVTPSLFERGIRPLRSNVNPIFV